MTQLCCRMQETKRKGTLTSINPLFSNASASLPRKFIILEKAICAAVLLNRYRVIENKCAGTTAYLFCISRINSIFFSIKQKFLILN